MAPLVAFCAFDPLFATSVSSSLYSPEHYKHSASVSEFSSSVSTRLDF